MLSPCRLVGQAAPRRRRREQHQRLRRLRRAERPHRAGAGTERERCGPRTRLARTSRYRAAMRLVSWNVAGRGGSLRATGCGGEARARRDCATGGLRARTHAGGGDGCASGYSVVSAVGSPRALSAAAVPRPDQATQIGRKNFNLTAARHPIAALYGLQLRRPGGARLAFPEKFVAVEVSVVRRADRSAQRARAPRTRHGTCSSLKRSPLWRGASTSAGNSRRSSAATSTRHGREPEGRAIETWAALARGEDGVGRRPNAASSNTRDCATPTSRSTARANPGRTHIA